MSTLKTTRTKLLEIAHLDEGPAAGWPVVLAHGFPYDVHAFDEVAPLLIEAGARVIVPYARGFGPTRFLSVDAMRNGQQAALGRDVIDLLDALGLESAMLAGYDWGGLASCVASALWPERVTGLVSYAGYDIADVERNAHAFAPALEHVAWYQHLFQSERGRECLTRHRRELCRMLWEQWSPGWKFDDATFERTASSFDNPDFVDVVIHCYRCFLGTAAGDPALASLEQRLAGKPRIGVPTITLDGARDPLKPGGTASHVGMFTARHEHRVVDCGHNLPWEAPRDFADAILTGGRPTGIVPIRELRGGNNVMTGPVPVTRAVTVLRPLRIWRTRGAVPPRRSARILRALFQVDPNSSLANPSHSKL